MNKRKYKILHIITSLDVGGAEKNLIKLLKYKSMDELEYEIICLKDIGSLSDSILKLNTKLYYAKLTKNPITWIVGFIKIFFFIKSSKADVIQTWLYHSDLIGGIFGKYIFRIPVIWNIRSCNVKKSKFMTQIVVKLCARLSYSLPEKIISVAKSSKNIHIKYGYNDKIIKVIPNGIYCGVNISTSNTPTINNFTIGSIGRFCYEKDHENLINASRFVIDKYPLTKFVLVGRNVDDSNDILINSLKKNYVIDNFQLVGEARDVYTYLNLFDIFCLPSRFEAFPNVILEAMLLRKPCVVTDVGDCREILKGFGVIVKRECPKELANGLIKVIEMNESIKKELCSNAYLTIQKYFSIEKVILEYETLYTNTANNRFYKCVA